MGRDERKEEKERGMKRKEKERNRRKEAGTGGREKKERRGKLFFIKDHSEFAGVNQESSCFLCIGTGSKHPQLYKPHILYCAYSTLPLQQEKPKTIGNKTSRPTKLRFSKGSVPLSRTMGYSHTVNQVPKSI